MPPQIPLQMLEDTTTPDPLTAIIIDETSEWIWKLVTELSDRQRQCITMFYGEDLQVTEVAKRLEISTGSVKFHLHAARKRLKTLLKPYINNDDVS